jgi:hypothetical protein
MDDDAVPPLPPDPAARPPLFRELPGWQTAEAAARKRSPWIPESAWRAAGLLMTDEPVQVIDPGVVLHFAESCLRAGLAGPEAE